MPLGFRDVSSSPALGWYWPKRFVRAVGVPWRSVARAEGDPVIVLEATDSQNRQAERFSQATDCKFFSSLRFKGYYCLCSSETTWSVIRIPRDQASVYYLGR